MVIAVNPLIPEMKTCVLSERQPENAGKNGLVIMFAPWLKMLSFALKTIFGDKLSARKLAYQLTEARIKTGILNKMRLLGMPQGYIAS